MSARLALPLSVLSIAFSLAGSGVHSLALTTQLPTITDSVDIDGTSQPGYAGVT